MSVKVIEHSWFSISELAGLSGIPKSESKVRLKAKRESWESRDRIGRGGGKEYSFISLPIEAQAALLKKRSVEQAEIGQDKLGKNNGIFEYNKDELWQYAERCTQKKRDTGMYRAQLLQQLMQLVDNGQTFKEAAKAIAIINSVSEASLRNWYHGVNNQVGAKHYEKTDWAAALIPGHTGRKRNADCDPLAWDWIKGHYLNRRQPTFSDSYRRLVKVADQQDWKIPSERTLCRRMKEDVTEATRVFLRQGPEALNQMFPPMKRDRTCFNAGEAVSGDGLKFDKVWVDWGDEIISTTTAWFWQDLHSNKFLAYRIAKTENTDVFRLATYDLTEICLPHYVQVDNTRVAANKAMTGKAAGRKRFKDKESDHTGILLQLGMDVHFTSPDHTLSNPGVKPVERSFGIGGIHDMVATHPKFINRGFSKKTAVPIDEFRAVVAEEVKRFNAQKNRRTDICRGVMSFDDAFNASFTKSEVRRATESQRRLLLLMPEKVKANRTTGVLTLKAGSSTLGKHRYWCEALTEHKGQDVVAYYDPEQLDKAVSVYTLDGRHIADADHKPTHAFNDTAVAREHTKGKKRILKNQKAIANETVRMNELERSALYPDLSDVEIPAPGVVRGNFGQRNQVDDDMKLKVAAGSDVTDTDDEEFDVNFSASIAQLRNKQEDTL